MYNKQGLHVKDCHSRKEQGNLKKKLMRIKAQSIRDAEALTTYIGNSIFIMENSYSGGCETLETPNISLFPSVLQVKVEVPLFNIESLLF